jgi:hypothetical protein
VPSGAVVKSGAGTLPPKIVKRRPTPRMTINRPLSWNRNKESRRDGIGTAFDSGTTAGE